MSGRSRATSAAKRATMMVNAQEKKAAGSPLNDVFANDPEGADAGLASPRSVEQAAKDKETIARYA